MKLFGIKYVFYSNEFGEITKEKVDTMELLHDSLALRIYKKTRNLASELKNHRSGSPNSKTKLEPNSGPT